MCYISEHMAVEEGYIPHRWTNMSASDNEGPREHKLLNSYYTPPGSETEDKAVTDKYLFPYTGKQTFFWNYFSDCYNFLACKPTFFLYSSISFVVIDFVLS